MVGAPVEREPGGADVDDAALAARAATDRAAFGLLYDRYAERVFRYCYRRLGNREAAEDATSQVFLKALVSLPNYRETGTFAGWLFAIAFSTTVDLERRRVHTTWTSPDKKLAAYQGTIVPQDSAPAPRR